MVLPVPIQWLVRRRGQLLLVALGLSGIVSAGPAVAAHTASTVAPPMGGQASGKVTFVGAASFTIQTGGRMMGEINALTASANAVTLQDYPYVWGGGHGAAGIASVGAPGPGFNGKARGYDCSGAVAAVLVGAGLWPAGSHVPNDAGVISALLRRGLIAPGPGIAPDEVTLYDHPGVHIFMSINGRFWGTSDGGDGADPRGGPGWLSDAAWDATSKHFISYHFLPSVLRNSTAYGQDYTFQSLRNPLLETGLLPGDAVRVAYAASGVGTMNAMQVSYPGALTATGTVLQVGLGGSSLTLVGRNGKSTTYDTGGSLTLTDRLALGDVVSVAYTSTPLVSGAPPVIMAHSAQVIAAAAPAQTAGTVTSIAASRAAFTIRTVTGQNQTLIAGGTPTLLSGVKVGEPVLVGVIEATGGLPIAEQVAPSQPPTTVTTPAVPTPPVTTPTVTAPTSTAPTGTGTAPTGGAGVGG